MKGKPLGQKSGSLTNNGSINSTVINLGTDFLCGTRMVMNGGSLTMINAMPWNDKFFQHNKGLLRIYNRFEHGYLSSLNGDAIWVDWEKMGY